MSGAQIQKLNALLKRVQARREQPRLLAVPAPLGAPQAAAANTVALPAEPDLYAKTFPPAAGAPSMPATLPPEAAASARSEPTLAPAPEPGRRAPSMSPLEDAMAQLGVAREDSGPLQVEALASPIHARERASELEPHMRVNQDLLVTHRPAADASAGPIVELVQSKVHTPREPTIQFDTGVKANPLTERELRPIGLPAQPPAEAPLTAPTHKLEPAPLSAHAAPARMVSDARVDTPKTFGELLELSLSLRPAAPPSTR